MRARKNGLGWNEPKGGRALLSVGGTEGWISGRAWLDSLSLIFNYIFRFALKRLTSVNENGGVKSGIDISMTNKHWREFGL